VVFAFATFKIAFWPTAFKMAFFAFVPFFTFMIKFSASFVKILALVRIIIVSVLVSIIMVVPFFRTAAYDKK
jgi:hypothetical protein